MNNEEEINLKDILSLFIHNLNYIIAFFIFFVLCGILVIIFSKPIYRADAVIFLEKKPPPTLFSKESEVRYTSDVDSYAELITKYDFCNLVIKNLNLNEEPRKYVKKIGYKKERQNFYTISFFSNISKEDAIRNLDCILNTFVEYITKFSKDKLSVNRYVYDKQLEEIKKDVEELEKKIKDFSTQQQIIELSSQKQELIKNIVKLESLLNETDVELISKTTQEKEIVNKLKELGIIISDETPLSELKLKMLALPRLESSLIEKLINLKIEIETLKSKKEKISEELNNYNKIMEGLPKKEFEYISLQREYEMKKQIYNSLAKNYADTTISSLGEDVAIKIVQVPIAADKPVFPKKRVILFISVLCWIVASIIFVFVKQSFLEPFVDIEEIKQLGLPIVKKVPYYKEIKGLKIYDLLVNKNVDGFYKNVIEEFENFLYKVNTWCHLEKPYKISFTSISPSEGKSLTAIFLAKSTSSQGKKTLLFDLDFYRGHLHKEFSENLKDDIVNVHQVADNLYIGIINKEFKIEMNELVKRGKDKLEKLEELYDVIIFDSPPVFAIKNFQLYKDLDINLFFVVNLYSTSKKSFIEAVEDLKLYGINVKGVVINKLPISDYYPYYKSYYQYYKKS
jgi:uncharacterized protein involved in exopolysaccharide biosynthesis/Mrp family chromosome partitioning ATPase